MLVVGAGPAGLAAAGTLRRAGVDPLVVDAADAVAAAWRQRHDHLRLNTHRMFSHQPGARIPRRCGPFPARDDYVAYLEDYAAPMRLRLGTRIGRADPVEGGWQLAANGGQLTAAHTVIATGPDAVPVMPTWPGLATFGGTVIHAGQFRHVADMAGRDVLVVGPGNSGVDLPGHLVALDQHGMPPYTGAVSSPQLPGLWFFGLDRSIYGNMHIHRRQARQLAQAITSHAGPRRA